MATTNMASIVTFSTCAAPLVRSVGYSDYEAVFEPRLPTCRYCDSVVMGAADRCGHCGAPRRLPRRKAA